MRHNRTLPLLTLTLGIAASGVASTAVAYEIYPPPKATLLLGNDLFQSGQSSNLGPAVSQTIDEYWISGPCPDGSNSYAYCDDLRFGMTFYGGDDGSGACVDDIVPIYAPQEDGGGLVESRISGLQNEVKNDPFNKYCDDPSFRVHDTGIRRHREMTFPGGKSADAATQKDWWMNANLTLHVIGETAQTSDIQLDGRALKTLQEACVSLYGGSPWTGGDPAGTLPAMPTWVMLARRYDDPAAVFGQLLAASGGSGTCCVDPTGLGTCDPIVDAIDMCSHVFDGRTDAQLRVDMAAAHYVCSGGASTISTGHLDFGDPPSTSGTLPGIRCHLVGETQNDNCKGDRRNPTNLLGLFRCIRPIPPGATGLKVCYENTYLRGDSVSAGRDHTCVLQRDGTAKCWGSNSRGQLGNGTNTSTSIPTAVSTLTGLKSIVAGERFTCALTENFDVYCWGEEVHFEHGDDNKNLDKNAPGPPVKNFSDAIFLDAGRDHACTILRDGTVWCWGSGVAGALGQGDTSDKDSPVQVPIYKATDLSAGWDYTCASVANGEVWCWGANDRGQVDATATALRYPTPTRVPALPAATRVATGYQHSCAVVDGAEVYCWGSNGLGQLGDGTTQDSSVVGSPVRASGLVGVIDVCVGHDFSCGVTGDGEMYCWGDVHADFGIGNAVPTPTQVPGVADARRVSCGETHACVLDDLGRVTCFGGAFSGTTATDVPVDVRVGDLDYLGPECISLEESRGDFEYVDPGKTLIILNPELCDTGDMFIPEYPCPINAPCATGLPGRCSEGIIRECDMYGDPICSPTYDAMPETCNGLDDDCDGRTDNLSSSIWGQDGLPNDLPPGFNRIHCNMENLCVCANGGATAHEGATFQSFIESWTPVCECAEGLAPDQSAYDPAPSSANFADPQAACTVQAVDSRTGGGFGAALLALLMGMGLMIWRRK